MLRRPRKRPSRFQSWKRRRLRKASRILLPASLLVFFGLWLHDPSTLTQSIAREQTSTVQTVTPSRLTVVDGDTVRLADETIRLVGYDTPETYRAQCNAERTRGEMATDRLRQLLDGASRVQLAYLPRRDRYERKLARLLLDGHDVADILVGERLARRYSGGQRGSWC